MLLRPRPTILILNRHLLSLHDPPPRVPRKRPFVLILERSVVVLVAPAAASGDGDGVDVVAHLGLVRRSVGAGVVAIGEVVPAGAGLDVADEDAEDGDAGCDDCDAGFGVAPDVEVDGRACCCWLVGEEWGVRAGVFSPGLGDSMAGILVVLTMAVTPALQGWKLADCRVQRAGV
jgi:hypothetical protein